MFFFCARNVCTGEITDGCVQICGRGLRRGWAGGGGALKSVCASAGEARNTRRGVRGTGVRGRQITGGSGTGNLVGARRRETSRRVGVSRKTWGIT